MTNTLATAAQQESRTSNVYPSLTQSRINNNNNSQWNNNLRLYPSLKDALSQKPHPLNVVNIPENEKRRETIGFEQINQSIITSKSSSSCSTSSSSGLPRSKTFDESLTLNDSSKQRFKRRGRNRPSSPLPPDEYSSTLTTNFPANQLTIETDSTSAAIQRKKKRIPISQPSLNRSSSSTASSQSFDDERQRLVDERRRQREERQKELVRFRRSQEIQRELDELEQKRLELDKRHVIARQNLRRTSNKMFFFF